MIYFLIPGVLMVIGALLVGVYETDIDYKKEHQASYEECKAHTTDLEWCFKQFKPEL